MVARIFACLSLSFVLNGLALADQSAAALADDDVTVNRENDTYFAKLRLHVAATPAVVQAVLTDFEHMADFVPNLTASRVLSRSGNVYRIYQQGNAVFGPFSFAFESERRIEYFPDGRIVAVALSGSAKSMRSELRYQGVVGGTRIDYQMEMVPDRWIPSGIGSNLMRHELAEQFSAVAREIERRQQLKSSNP